MTDQGAEAVAALVEAGELVQEAQAGESSTTGAAPARAAAAAAGTAASRVPAISCGTPYAASVAARAGASRPISTARAMRGKKGARLSMPPSFAMPPAIHTTRP